MLRQRLLSAFFGLPVLVVLLWLNWLMHQRGNTDDLVLLLLVLFIAAMSGWEVSSVVRHRYPHAGRWNGLYAALILPFLVHSIRPAISLFGDPVGRFALLIDSLGATACLMLLFLAVWSDIELRGREGIKENLLSVGGGLYLGVTLSFLLLLGETPLHEMAVAMLFVGVITLDTAAYFGGILIGGEKLAPRISPKKTWSGAITGLLACILIIVALYAMPALPGIIAIRTAVPWWALLLIGTAIGILGQLGDLLESAFKRWASVKDSGDILPGHGGFLDRFDSLFLAAPVAYILLRLFL